MAEPASDGVAAARRAVGQFAAQRLHGAGLEGRAIETAAPDMDRLARARPADRRDAQAGGEGRVDAGVDQGEILAGNELDDLRLRLRAAVETDRERAEGRDVFGSDHPDLVARDGDDRTGTDAVVLRSARHDNYRTIADAAERVGAGRGGQGGKHR